MVQLNLVVLRSIDIDKAADFYRLLGLEFSRHQHGSGPFHYACEMGETVFEIYPQQKEGEGSSGTRVGFRVEHLNSLLSRLEKAGVIVISAAKDSPWGRRAVVQYPDGHRVELIELAP